MLALAVALGMVAEAFFRGVLYGTLLDPYRPPPGSWRPSLPLVASSVLYAGASLVPTMPLARRSFTEPGTIAVSFVAALVFGFACGYAREQSESLLPPLLFHALAVVVVHLAGLV
jgi:membrane protease YdiL (CAAX protease family)